MKKTIQEITIESLQKMGIKVPGEKVLAAVSGGPDSMVLLYILHRMGLEVEVAHCNYNLRPESTEEAVFVKKVCDELGLVFHLAEWDTYQEVSEDGLSVQMKARELRYAFFEGLMNEREIHYCCTAHHLDDQIETMLLSLVRGASNAYLRGIPQKRDRYIRPLLAVSKSSILEYAEQENIEFRVDISNESNDYLRNKIRNQVIPILEEINPSLKENLIHKSDRIRVLNALLSNEKAKIFDGMIREDEGRIRIQLDHLLAIEDSLLRKMILEDQLADWGISSSTTASVFEILHSPSGKEVRKEGWVFQKDRSFLSLFRNEEMQSNEERTINENELPLEFDWGDWRLSFEFADSPIDLASVDTGVHWMDGTRLKWPITCKNWQEGDSMQPFGMLGKRKLSDIMIDLKWDLYQKRRAVVLQDQDQIICLSDYRIADDVKIVDKGSRGLKVTIRKTD